jgi:hypothetical protein
MEERGEKSRWGVRLASVTSTTCARVPLTSSHREVDLTLRTEIVGVVVLLEHSADADIEIAKMWSLLAEVVGLSRPMLRNAERDEMKVDHWKI